MYRLSSKYHLSSVSKGVLETLLYFDIFNYPLTFNEVQRCNSQPEISKDELKKALNYLVQNKLIFQFEDLYSLHPIRENVDRRRAGNARAERAMEKARSMSNIIARFPFVRSVCLSGSISKDYMDEETDVDFFIITAPRRLWIARMSLIIFKKIFLLNSRKYFCVNYFIATDRLEVEEKNLFTAIEIKTLLPTFGEDVYHQFHRANEWTNNYFPNFEVRPLAQPQISNGWIHKKMVEKLLSNSFGDWIENKFMRFTVRVWKLKFKDFDERSFEVAMKSKPYVSKHHPNHFQERVLKAYSDKRKAFEQQHNISLAGNE